MGRLKETWQESPQLALSIKKKKRKQKKSIMIHRVNGERFTVVLI